jgi:ribosome-binding factor A
VFDVLSYALGETSDPLLLDLVLDRVEPLQGDRHLLVVVRDPAHHGLLVTLGALDRARGFLRSVVAENIHRSKAPQLSFSVAPEGGDA